jgi:predicted dehydrogenase
VDRVRLAIVGCGNICQLNAPGYLEHERCDVVALCDTDRGRAERRAREWGLTPRIYTDYGKLLDDSGVDALELLTPTYLHAEQIVAALAAGKHVSCQKPISISVAEADRVAEAVGKARTTFRVTENFLYYPPIVKAKELLDAGAIGEVSAIVSYQKDFLQEVPSVAHWRFKDRDCLGIIDYTYAPDMPIRSRSTARPAISSTDCSKAVSPHRTS